MEERQRSCEAKFEQVKLGATFHSIVRCFAVFPPSNKLGLSYSSSNRDIRRKAFPPCPYLSWALFHDAPLFTNKRGQSIEWPALSWLFLGLALFEKQRTLAGHLTSAVMTEANTCSIEGSTNGCGTEAKQHRNRPFVLFCSEHEREICIQKCTWHFYFNNTCFFKRVCSGFKMEQTLLAFLRVCIHVPACSAQMAQRIRKVMQRRNMVLTLLQ